LPLGPLAPVYVLVASIAFIFVALEHLEIAHRYPRGGGGVALNNSFRNKNPR